MTSWLSRVDALGRCGIAAEDLPLDSVLVILEAVEDREVGVDGGVEQPVDEGFGAQCEQFPV